MYRPAFRAASATALSKALPRSPVTRRFVSTAPPHKKSRSLRSSAVRWGLAGGLVYYYNTATTFAEEPAFAIHAPPETSRENETYPTIETVAEQRRTQSKAQAPIPSTPTETATIAVSDDAGAIPGSPEGLEEEAGQQGAFNEETGEINWDCPCLGGMANGPCGEQFKAAFSCFVYSKDEPKGVDCIDHFKTMQNCFREHPDVYGAELDDEDAPQTEISHDQSASGTSDGGEPTSTDAPSLANMNSPHGRGEKVSDSSNQLNSHADSDNAIAGRSERAEAATAQVKRDHGPQSESARAVPKEAHDATKDKTDK